MKAIRKQRNAYALLTTASLCLALGLGASALPEAAFAFGAVSVAGLLLFIKHSYQLYDATLIWDNCILAVPSAVVTVVAPQGKKDAEETVVSTFGILIGSKIYRWGLDGVHGVRLQAAEFDRHRLCLRFGDAAQTIQLELLHGMSDKRALLAVKEKLWRETGVSASIVGW